uniref:Uncharacterized protein n=1 Tax=Oryza punctata TaxID=4537 RepID=A0A1V1H5N6_ORYPU|nr:hypothetical protein [Oryza punctata]
MARGGRRRRAERGEGKLQPKIGRRIGAEVGQISANGTGAEFGPPWRRADPPADVAVTSVPTASAPMVLALRMFKKDEVGFAPEQLPPPGVKRPMCWYWMCRNYSYSPEKPKPVPKGRKGKVKIPVKEPEVPPPICDFVEWIDKEMSEFDKRLIKSWRERQEEREDRQRQRAANEKAERERREELELRELARLNREKEERAEDRSRKLARAQRAKDAGSEAARKGKYPRCIQ